ncbi:MAG: hypothetical protein IT376_10235 [Polyangiaceae bacterium]|nr:hypothetical protein [Polyangiaceae bacterium]
MSRAALALALAALQSGCSSESTPARVIEDAAVPGREVRPGVGVGEITLGARLEALPEAVGTPEQTIVNQRLGFVRYPGGLELVITSPEAYEAAPSSLVVAVGVSQAEGYRGLPVPGQARGEIEAVLGAPADEIELIAYYASGASVTYAGGVAAKVAVFEPYENRPAPPEMEPAP